MEELRQELKRIVEASPKWDKKVCGLQVTNMTERTVELRALVSARSAGETFELRCEVREKLMAYIQKHHPGALPKTRAALEADTARALTNPADSLVPGGMAAQPRE